MTFAAKLPKSVHPIILERLSRGETYAQIGAAYGVSRQRVCTIAKKYGAHGTGLKVRQSIQKEKVNKKMRRIYGEFFEDGEITDEALARQCRAKFRYKKHHAKSSGIPFEIGFEDVKWNLICPILGIKIDYFNTGIQVPNSASFDRVDGSMGYVKGNVQIISQRANIIKNDGTADEHMRIAEYIIQNSLLEELSMVSNG